MDKKVEKELMQMFDDGMELQNTVSLKLSCKAWSYNEPILNYSLININKNCQN